MEMSQEATFVAVDSAEVGMGSVRHPVISANFANSGFPLPDPEEGYRLMRSFLGIREAALRQAITELVMQISALTSDHPAPSA